MSLDAAQRDLVQRLSARYIWWERSSLAKIAPERVLAQVMEMGDWRDVRQIECAFGPDVLRNVVRRAEPGWFTPRSWRFWHTRLGLIDALAASPDLPRRRIP